MGTKGEKTKQYICKEAYQLFAEKGYKRVTMKDICEKTGLSRGGLYRHYDSTEQIFLEIIDGFTQMQSNEFSKKIAQHIPAVKILDDVLMRYANEMIDNKNSLSLAIYEFYSNPEISKTENTMIKQYEASKSMWVELIDYGMKNKEFKKVDAEAVFDVIVFSYQGVRMHSKLMKMDSTTPKRIILEIKKLLLPEEE
ncbi:MAG: TetR/AcrR family transcriptional regulator [Treponema sp.]|nr:TetR/AcrR family transcriptional regulator [Treponema sp.]